MDRLRWKLVRLAALSMFTYRFALSAIRPSFWLDACSWNATEIVVLAPATQSGTFRVVEVIKGGLAPGASLELPGLKPSQKGTAKLAELAKGVFFSPPFEDVPPVGQGDRLIVFLRRPGSLPEWGPRPDLPVDASGWESANTMGDLRTSTVWIQDGVTYDFDQPMNPGPTRLSMLLMSEAELRRSIQSVLHLRDAMDRAVANTDPVERSLQLAALVRSDNRIARMSALQKLERGGAPETNVLLGLLSDQSLLGWHDQIIDALAGKPVSGEHFAQFLSEETAYWSQACLALKTGWWNDTGYPGRETARSHYTRARALLDTIHESNLSAAMPAVRDFAAVWSGCPSLEARETTNQVAEALKLLLGR